MKKVHVFARYGYEEHDYSEFDSRAEAAEYIRKETENNERNGNGWYVVAVVEGIELPVNIVKKQTEVSFG